VDSAIVLLGIPHFGILRNRKEPNIVSSGDELPELPLVLAIIASKSLLTGFGTNQVVPKPAVSICGTFGETKLQINAVKTYRNND
jgi:hypothetical protein